MLAEDFIQKLALKRDNFGTTIHFYEYRTPYCIKTRIIVLRLIMHTPKWKQSSRNEFLILLI